MNKPLIKITIYIVAGITLIICLLSIIFPSITVVKYISSIATISEVLIILYCKFLWKIRFLNFLKIKNLNGEWNCKISYKYNGIYGEKDTVVSIKQDLFEIQINMSTDEVSSYSISSAIISEHNRNYLVYTYRTEALKEVRDKNRDQWGTAKLNIEDGKMIGEYWTNNKTDGTMLLVKVHK